MLPEQPDVGVVLVHPPGNNRAGVAPGGHAGEHLVGIGHVGRDVGIPPVIGLRVANVLDPLREEGRHVHVEDGRLRESLDIAHPPFTLGALGAIGRGAHQVRPLGPDDVLHQPGEERVGTLEQAGVGRRGVEHASQDRVLRRARRQPAELHVAETVIGEVRLEDFFAPAAERVLVDLGRAAEIGRVERAVVA